jgi:hypothetical protein
MNRKTNGHKDTWTDRQIDVIGCCEIDDVTETNLSKQAKRDKEAFLFKGSNSFIF